MIILLPICCLPPAKANSYFVVIQYYPKYHHLYWKKICRYPFNPWCMLSNSYSQILGLAWVESIEEGGGGKEGTAQSAKMTTVGRWLVRLQRRAYKRLRLGIGGGGSGDDIHGWRTRSLPCVPTTGRRGFNDIALMVMVKMKLNGVCARFGPLQRIWGRIENEWYSHRNSTVVVARKSFWRPEKVSWLVPNLCVEEITFS